MASIVIYDACVLYPFTLRDVLIRLAMTRMFRARWTEDIHREWMEALLRDKPGADVERIRRLMDAAVEDCLVTGHEDLVARLQLPDLKDRHVLAAAITARAEVIVTINIKHFPRAVLEPHGVTASHPDDFIHGLMDVDEETVYRAVEAARVVLRRPALSSADFRERLKASGLSKTAQRMARIEGMDDE